MAFADTAENAPIPTTRISSTIYSRIESSKGICLAGINFMKTLSQPPPLHFTEADSDKAFIEWKASCGPHSIAAACGISLDAVRAVLPIFKGWMSPTMVGETLRALGRVYHLQKGLKTAELCNGINRIQWEGDWLKPGVPARVAYFHTHWVAHFNGGVLCTACTHAEWISVEEWKFHHLRVDPISPFHITHHYELTRPA